MDNQDQNPLEDGGRQEGGKREFGGGGRRFGRRKVCPFILDKTLVLDFKNLRVINRFVSETGKIVPRHISGVSAKSQRKLAKHIKRARNVGFVAPLIDG
jgi:small subunit ribosomal protein S18